MTRNYTCVLCSSSFYGFLGTLRGLQNYRQCKSLFVNCFLIYAIFSAENFLYYVLIAAVFLGQRLAGRWPAVIGLHLPSTQTRYALKL